MVRRAGLHPLKVVVLLVSAALLLSSCFAIAGRAIHMYRIRQDEARLLRDLAQLEARAAALRAQQELYRSEDFLERVAREELGLVKPGETGVIVVQQAAAADLRPGAVP